MAEEQSEDIRKAIVKQRSSSGRMDAGLSNYVFGKVPPQARDLEEAVLGAMMLEKDAVVQVFDILKEESFYVEAHQLIFRAMKNLFAQRELIDIVTVTEELRKQGNLKNVGGGSAISSLAQNITSASNVVNHSRIIEQKYMQRELIKISTKITENAYQDGIDVKKLITDSEKNFSDLVDKVLNKNDRPIDVLISKSLKNLDQMRKPEIALTGVSSGFTALDQLTSGWQKNDLIIVAARPGMGKTAFVLSLMRNAAIDDKRSVVMFSLEMSNLQLTNRLLSAETEIPSEKLRGADVTENEWSQLTSKINRLSESPIFIDDTPAISIFELRAKCRRLKASHDVQMIIIDYLQLMSNDTENNNVNRHQEISRITRDLKGLARELEVPVIVVSQLNRSVETRGGDKRPQLTDLHDSGSIEQDADIVIFLYRPEYYKFDNVPFKGLTEVIIAKHRNGQLTTVPLKFIDYLMKFSDLDPQDSPWAAQQSDFTKNPEGNIITRKSSMTDMDESGPAPW